MPRTLGLLALAALAFVATASATRQFVPLPDYADLAPRFERFTGADEAYDLIFLGPSTTRCSFDPRVVDADLAKQGHPIRSANLGLPGANYFEIDHMVERLVERRPAGLRWLVIELHPPGFNALIRPQNLYTDRVTHWHTPRQLGDIVKALAQPRDGQGVRVDRMLVHLRHALWRFANVGQADRIVATFRSGDDDEVDERRGFAPENCSGARVDSPEHPASVQSPTEFRKRAGRLDRQNRTPVPTRQLNPEKLRRQVASLRAIGVEPVYVMTPILSPVPGIHTLRRHEVLPNLLAFDSPERYPEFYALAMRRDELHLNETGAELFSHEFASHFARWLDTGLEP